MLAASLSDYLIPMFTSGSSGRVGRVGVERSGNSLTLVLKIDLVLLGRLLVKSCLPVSVLLNAKDGYCDRAPEEQMST